MSTSNTKYGPLPNVSVPYLSLMEKYSNQFNVPVPIIAGTIKTESSGNPQAWNPSLGENSRGLMQISERTASGPPLSVSDLSDLFDPDYNIYTGTKYLGYIRDSLRPYFRSGTPEDIRWKVISSSYNQGWGYYKTALQTLNEMGMPQTWDNIEYYVLNPVKKIGTPWESNVKHYADSVMSSITSDQLKAGGVSLVVVLALGGLGYYAYKKNLIARFL